LSHRLIGNWSEKAWPHGPGIEDLRNGSGGNGGELGERTQELMIKKKPAPTHINPPCRYRILVGVKIPTHTHTHSNLYLKPIQVGQPVPETHTGWATCT
jgi:hypothetical protein